MSSKSAKQVKKRRVFYIPGYDPIHPRRYRELYRTEGRAQADISGYDIGLKPKTGKGNYGWHVESTIKNTDVEADVEVLVWSDIVRDSMANSIIATYWQMIRTAWVYIAYGVLWRLMRLRKGPVIAALYPVGMLIVQFLLALGAFFAVGRLVGFVSRALEEAFYGPVQLLAALCLRKLVAVAPCLPAHWCSRWCCGGSPSNDGKFFALLPHA